jgi:hypothetical protein
MSEALIMGNRVVIEELVGLENLIERVGAVERKKAKFWGFEGIFRRRGGSG